MNTMNDLHSEALMYNTWLNFYMANATDVDGFDELTDSVAELGFPTRYIVDISRTYFVCVKQLPLRAWSKSDHARLLSLINLGV